MFVGTAGSLSVSVRYRDDTRWNDERRFNETQDTLHFTHVLNKTFGKNSVYFGGAHGATDYAPMRIAFTRIPDPELEEIDRSRNRRLKPASPPSAAADRFGMNIREPGDAARWQHKGPSKRFKFLRCAFEDAGKPLPVAPRGGRRRSVEKRGGQPGEGCPHQPGRPDFAVPKTPPPFGIYGLQAIYPGMLRQKYARVRIAFCSVERQRVAT